MIGSDTESQNDPPDMDLALKDLPEKLIMGRAGWMRRDSHALQGPLTFSELCFTYL